MENKYNELPPEQARAFIDMRGIELPEEENIHNQSIMSQTLTNASPGNPGTLQSLKDAGWKINNMSVGSTPLNMTGLPALSQKLNNGKLNFNNQLKNSNSLGKMKGIAFDKNRFNNHQYKMKSLFKNKVNPGNIHKNLNGSARDLAFHKYMFDSHNIKMKSLFKGKL